MSAAVREGLSRAQVQRLASPLPLAGEVASHRRCVAGEGFLLLGSLASGDSALPTPLPQAGEGAESHCRANPYRSRIARAVASSVIKPLISRPFSAAAIAGTLAPPTAAPI